MKLYRPCLVAVFLVPLISMIGRPVMPQSSPDDLRRCQSNLQSLGIALDRYAEDHFARFPNRAGSQLTRQDCARMFNESLVPRYLPRVPTCPAAGRDTYSEGYWPSSGSPDGSGEGFVLRCRGRNHVAAGAPSNFPTSTGLGPVTFIKYRGGSSHSALPSDLKIDGVSLGAAKSVVVERTTRPLEGKGGFRTFCYEGRWGINYDDTFFPTGDCLSSVFVYDSSERVRMLGGRTLSIGDRLLAAFGTPVSVIVAALGEPDWTTEGVHLRIYERGDKRLTICGDKTLTYVLLVKHN